MNVYDFAAERLNGQVQSLSDYRGQVLLVVNTASQCGLTPQYQGLQTLYTRYRDQGFAVLGFPCNQFAGQEPGSAADIQSFCSSQYGVTFPLFSKIEVNGPGAHPLYQWLKQQAPGSGPNAPEIEWNFAKFLIDRAGHVVKRYPPQTQPEDLAADIEALLAAPRA
ncbi:MAG: glutathione peroxidase [Alicyclobacillus sp.]|nr:glutathione peroxidase [Alicyclobacillus sp.]